MHKRNNLVKCINYVLKKLQINPKWLAVYWPDKVNIHLCKRAKQPIIHTLTDLITPMIVMNWDDMLWL